MLNRERMAQGLGVVVQKNRDACHLLVHPRPVQCLAQIITGGSCIRYIS